MGRFRTAAQRLTAAVIMTAIALLAGHTADASPATVTDSNARSYLWAENVNARCDGTTHDSKCYWAPSSTATTGWFYRGCGLTRFHWSNGRDAYFVVGGGGHVYVIYQQADWSWSRWYDFGGVSLSRVFVEWSSLDRPTISVAGTDANDWALHWNGSTWNQPYWYQYHVPGQYQNMC